MGSGAPRRIGFFLGGRRKLVAPGRNLAELLTDRRVPILQRSIRYHRPRGPFCGTGACTRCLVRVNGVPNVRACRYLPKEGDRVVSENAWPSPRYDLGGILDLLFPGGIDSVRGFRRPAFARPLYQWVVRRMAAFGRLPDPPPGPVPAPTEAVTTESLIVGAGPAGRAAAQRLVELGERPVVIDRRRGLPEIPGADLRTGVTAGFLPPPRSSRSFPFELLASTDEGTGFRFGSRKVVVATGSYDGALWFGDADRPGVITAEGAEALTDPDDRPPFRRALVFGGGARAAGVLARWSEEVEAVAAPGSIGPEATSAAAAAGVPLFPRSLLLRALGRRGVRGAVLKGRAGGPTVRLEIDAIVLAHRRLPNNPLLFQAGASMHWEPNPGGYFPALRGSATTIAGLTVAGSVGRSLPSGAEATSGSDAAERAHSPAPWPEIPPEPSAPVPSEWEGYYRELLNVSPDWGRWTACPCEDVHLSELREANRRGYRGIEVAKRYTGLGTGLCQGRYCLPEALLALGIWEGRPPPEVGYIRQRPPVLPVPLGALAGLPEAAP